MHSFVRLLLVAILFLPCSPAIAGYDLTLGAGWFDFSRSDDSSANFLGEWRGNYIYRGLRPVIGAMANTDGGIYGYAGFDYDWEFMPHWVLVPGLDVGAWRQGSSIDLGGTFEFHESIELDYKFDNNYRAGLQVTHTSNAGIYDTNPGVNTLMATFSIPLY